MKSDASLSNITYTNNTVTFDVILPREELDYAVIANPGNGVYSAGDVFTLELVQAEGYTVSSVGWFFDDEPVNGTSVTLKAGSHTVEAAVTLESGDVRTVSLEIEAR